MTKTKFVVLTGGPGAGKTAVLELLKKQVCPHVAILPESASILFGGGFWRLSSASGRIAAQKAIFYVQKQMEYLVESENHWKLGLCDRGTIDALAFWPKSKKSFWEDLHTTKRNEYLKYAAVIHLRTPSEAHGYNRQNPIRTESSAQAAEIDLSIKNIWKDHPDYHEIESSPDFMTKAQKAISILSNYFPNCCHKNRRTVTPT